MKTVVITGASRGIGFATAKKFLAEGWFVIGTSTSGQINIDAPNFKAIRCDYLKPNSIKEAVDEIEEMKKQIDVLINNAGIAPDDIDVALDIKILREDLAVNVIGTADFTNQLLESIKSPGHIINISSRAASMIDPVEQSFYVPAYKISKAALNMYTRTMGYHLKSKKITVSSLDPGWVKTDMGGEDASRMPEEAAEDIYNLAISSIETGQFWLNGKKRNW